MNSTFVLIFSWYVMPDSIVYVRYMNKISFILIVSNTTDINCFSEKANDLVEV